DGAVATLSGNADSYDSTPGPAWTINVQPARPGGQQWASEVPDLMPTNGEYLRIACSARSVYALTYYARGDKQRTRIVRLVPTP
ncbi:MAG: hypothetical protein Q7T55_16990, partial [Solirubrobacteraceae bacterium]|nr:hypothetical protein [Solirubrobacteraceae bacterium]